MAPRFVCAHIRAMEGVLSNSAVDAASSGERLIKLNNDENPFPPSPKVMHAIREIEPEMLRRYSSARDDAFRELAVRDFGVSTEMILCADGCEAVLAAAVQSFVGAGGKVASATPGKVCFARLARQIGAEVLETDWHENWSLPAGDLCAMQANAIFISNPNDPSGTIIPREQIGRLADNTDGAVVIDESSIEFAGEDATAVPLVKDHENIVVVRSMNAAYSLGGLPFGYAIAQESVISAMVRCTESVNTIAAMAAYSALEDREHAQMTWQHVRSERTRVTRELESIGWHVVPSHANFLLASVPGARGRDIFNRLKRQGILVRRFDSPALAEKVRITIGTSQENNALLGGIKSLSISEKAA